MLHGMADQIKIIEPSSASLIDGIDGIVNAAAQPIIEVRADGRPVRFPGPGANFQNGGLVKFLYKSDDAAIKNMNVDGSVTPVKFIIQPPVDEDYELVAMRLTLADTGMAYSSFGGIAALTNGLLIRIIGDFPAPDTVLIDILDGIPVKDNAQLSSHLIDRGVAEITGGTLDLFTGSVRFADDINTNLILEGATNQRLEVLVQDNLTGLVYFYIKVLGYRIKRT